jgi:hypothetical protein
MHIQSIPSVDPPTRPADGVIVFTVDQTAFVIAEANGATCMWAGPPDRIEGIRREPFIGRGWQGVRLIDRDGAIISMSCHAQ